jgi:hypothetical protein
VKHHRVETELLQLRQLPIKRTGLPDGRTVRIGPFAEVPRAETEFVSGFHDQLFLHLNGNLLDFHKINAAYY